MPVTFFIFNTSAKLYIFVHPVHILLSQYDIIKTWTKRIPKFNILL